MINIVTIFHRLFIFFIIIKKLIFVVGDTKDGILENILLGQEINKS